MSSNLNDFSRLSVHTQTTKPWSIDQCIEHYAAAEIPYISVWRHVLEGKSLNQVKQKIKDAGLKVSALVRGGFFPSIEPEQRKAALEDNLNAIAQAEAIGAPMVVLVCGADGRQSLTQSRAQIEEGIQALIPRAKEAGVQLAIEPLHPMYAGDKSAIVSLDQANDLAEAIQSDWVGVAVDVYHLWWDKHLESEIKRCGQHNNLLAFHVCDWKVPTTDFLTDRGLMGEGCIPVPQIRSWVEDAGFKGPIEVEIFSDHYWQLDQKDYLEKIKTAYQKHT